MIFIDNDKTVTKTSTSENDDNGCEIYIGLVVMLTITSVIAITIIIILSWRLCNQKKRNGKLDKLLPIIFNPSVDVITVPASAPLQSQLNGDNIKMQLSPAYVSIDIKSPRLYQNI